MAITGQANSSLDQALYDKIAYFSLRAELLFDQVATVKGNSQEKGSSEIFTIDTDMAVATSPISETVDVAAVTLADSQVTVTLEEYGNVASTTRKLRGTAFRDPDMSAARRIGFNAGDSMDTVVRDVLAGGSNVIYGGSATSRTTILTTSIIVADNVRRITAQLRNAKVTPFNRYFVGFINPDVSYDLRRETGNAAWNAPHVAVDTEGIYNGEIGTFESVRFIESARTTIRTNASNGSGAVGTTDVYDTYIVGDQALAKAWSDIDGGGVMPTVVRGPVIDALNRFHPIGWYWLGGYAIFRQEAIRRIETSSTLGVV